MNESRLQHYLKSNDNSTLDPGTVAYLASLDKIALTSPEISDAIAQELIDQRTHLKLIASENYSSLAVQLAMGNLLTDKYAEGYPHHRFYAGCDNVDTVEDLAVQQLKTLFNCDHAYVQPHSGADANLIAFWAALCQRIQSKEIEKLNKKSVDELTEDEHEVIRKLMNSQVLLGMSLNSGGHLTHGYRHNISSKMMRAYHYDIDPATGVLNYLQILNQAKKIKPFILLAGYSSYPRLINFAKMREIADEVGAILMVDMAHFAGLVAGKAITGEYNPIPFAHFVTSTTHKVLRGPRGGFVLCKEEFAESVNRGCPLVMGGPLPHVIAAKAIAFKEANTSEYQQYANQVIKNAKALAAHLQTKGLSVLTGGTDNHIVIIDLGRSELPITGRQAEKALLDGLLTVNRNAIPFDTNGPWYTSGIRIGTPAITTLGMREDEMKVIADAIFLILTNTSPSIVEKTGKASKANYSIEPNALHKARGIIKELLKTFPLYPEILL